MDNDSKTPPPGKLPPNFHLLIPHQFLPGVSGNPNGRRRKFMTEMKDCGYALSEVGDTIKALLACRLDELKDIYESPNATILEKTVANALRKGLEKGSLYNLETLLSRGFGTPVQQVEQVLHHNGPIEIKVTTMVGAPPLATSEAEIIDV